MFCNNSEQQHLNRASENEHPKIQGPRNMHGLLWIAFTAAIYSSTSLFPLDSIVVANIQSAINCSINGVEKLTPHSSRS